MGRVFPVALIALIIVAGGIWLDGQARDEAQQAELVVQNTPPPVAPAGFEVIPPVTEERELTFGGAAPVLEEGVDYHALLDTSKGEMIIDLFEERAPETVNNFVFLALHNYYDGVPFHRVLEDFMAQTGDPSGTGRGGPGYTFPDEIHPELDHDSRGIVSMANAGPDTNGSQFFITLVATPWLDGRHAVFGKVIEGDEVLDELQRVDPGTPTAVLRFDGNLSELAEQGVDLGGPPDRSLRDHLEAELGAIPAVGQSFTIGGYVGVVGRVDGVPAAGFFPEPDTLEDVTILARTGETEEAEQ
ncbi:MAG TPA: peptidylprolyl isomerase [Trueperaceae bacterium]